jgi:hypothetical protein
MIAPPQPRVPQLRDSFIVAKPGSQPACWWGSTVGIERSETAPANFHPTETFKSRGGLLRPAYPQHRLRHRVPHPFQSHRKAEPPPALLVGCKGWVIEQSETAVAYFDPTKTSKVEVH